MVSRVTDKIETIDVGEVNWNATAVQYMELNKQKTEAIQRVRELHEEIDSSDCNDPDCCPMQDPRKFCSECGIVYPCPTIQALDGEQK
jgi:hypothetical protein